MRRGAVAVLAAAVLAAAPPARAADPAFAAWPSLLPSLAQGFTPSTFAVCRNGSRKCAGRTIRRMQRRLAKLDATCDHRALFLRNYLTVTQHFAQLPKGFFEDDRYLAHEDAVFAQLYFDAFDAHAAGRRSRVPEAWLIAFDAARARTHEGIGDLLLGINAHVQRDMPFMLAGLGLVAKDGRSRKTDHDAFNTALNASYDEVIRRAAAVDDPRIGLAELLPLGGEVGFQLVTAWREGVWRNAERLHRARTPQERADVARSIEDQAAATARIIQSLTAYRDGFNTGAERLAHCRSKPRDPGPGSPPSDLSRKDVVRAGGLVLRRP